MKEWLKDAVIRAVKTFAQSLISSGVTLSIINGAIDWTPVVASLVTAAGATILSFLMSLTKIPNGEEESAE